MGTSQRGRDAPPARKKGRGRIVGPTSTPRPTQSKSELVFSNTSRTAGSGESTRTPGSSDEFPDHSGRPAAGDAEFHNGFPVILRIQSRDGDRRRWELVAVRKADHGERARVLESLLFDPDFLLDDGLAGVRGPCSGSVPGQSRSAAVRQECEQPLASV